MKKIFLIILVLLFATNNIYALGGQNNMSNGGISKQTSVKTIGGHNNKSIKNKSSKIKKKNKNKLKNRLKSK